MKPWSDTIPGHIARGLAVCAVLALAAVRAPAGPPQSGPYPRPDHERIRRETGNVLQEPSLATRQSLSGWLKRQFGKLNWPDNVVPPGVGRIATWILLAWCVITLVAIVAHVVWAALTMRGPKRRLALEKQSGGGQADQTVSLNQLYESMRECAQQGEYARAVRWMLAIVLRYLDRAQVVRIESGKTNGEYLSEYLVYRPRDQAFCGLVRFFDAVVYGGRECSRQDYEHMYEILDRIRTDVSQGTNN